MTKPEFKFIERYRTLAPGAGREVIEARHKAHTKLYDDAKQSMQKVHTLCGIAFGLQRDTPLITDWFEKGVKELDGQFMIGLDKAEAARIASLILEDMVTQGIASVALAVLSVSYCGRREPGDDGLVLTVAKDALERNGRARQIISAGKTISPSAPEDLKTQLDTAAATFNGANVRAVAEGILGEIKATQEELAESATAAFQAVRSDNVGLAEELDMLWWNMANWSDLLEKRRDQLSPAASAFCAAIELGAFVQSPPGPYGVYGILRHALGEQFSTKTTLKKAITTIADDAAKLRLNVTTGAMPLLPVSAAISHVAANGASKWPVLKQIIGDALTVEVSYFELAVQSYRERVLISNGGL
ncbi:MAG: hypothetical protein IH604_10675 [Burkholderiales bacterium]|nr:hypothetical protein [Burkholderiales bacterium]